jgi:hypothetical protein
MTVPLRPLGLAKDLIEAVGLDVTYVYDDLIFIEHNAFLLQMEEKGENIGLWFNTESTPSNRPEITTQLKAAGKTLSLNVSLKGTFSITRQDDNDNETFQILFNDQEIQ